MLDYLAGCSVIPNYYW